MRRYTLDASPLRESPEFRTIFIARTISIFGIGFLAVAIPVQIYSMTTSTGSVAVVVAILGASAFAGTLAGGVLADRFDRRNVIVAARGAATVGFTVLAVNAMLPSPSLWMILGCAVIDGIAGGISSTALLTVVPSLIPREKLSAAGALMALMTDLGSMASPALGGLFIAAAGVAPNYWFAAAASLITTVLITRLPPMASTDTSSESPLAAVLGGFRYALSHKVIGGVLAVGCVAMILSGWGTLIPAYVESVLGGGPETVGLLFAAPAIGAVLGSLTSGWTGTVRRSGQLIFTATMISALALAGAGAVAATAVAFVGLSAHGAGRVLSDIPMFAVVQFSTEEQYRGRVSGAWTAQITASVTLGAGVAALISALVPIRYVFLVYGLTGATATLALWASLAGLRAVGQGITTQHPPQT